MSSTNKLHSRMRILVIGPHPPVRGGIADTNRELCELLARTHDVEVVSFTSLYPRFLFRKQKADPTKFPKPTYAVHELLDSLNPFSWERAAQHILDRAPDRVIFHWWTTFLVPAYVYLSFRLKNKIKMGALVHNTFPHGGNAA